MNGSNETIRKYAEYFLTNNREVMEAADIAELEQALKETSVELVRHGFENDAYVVRLLDCKKPVYIVIESGMIFVDHHEPDVLTNLILTEDYEADESYDTTDGCDYYSKSKYAEFIVCGLLNVVNKLMMNISYSADDETTAANCAKLKQTIDDGYAAADTDEKLDDYYSKNFTIGFDNQQVIISCCADAYSAVIEALDYIIATHQ